MDKRKRCSQSSGTSEAVLKKPKLESRKKRPGIAQEIYQETTYYILNGLRHVKPYYFTFTTHAKGRWVGSKIFDVFCREFQSESPGYYEHAIKSGKVTVNGNVATMETVVNNNQLITHRVHRHEPPVVATPLNIIHQDKDMIVLDKPPSIPVHPCGRYRHNSVVFLLAKEHNLINLHTVHRLDRLTSGLLMFARTLGKAQTLETEIRERRVCKVYVCRVEGEFPSEPVECKEPILVVSHKVGVCRVDPTGKECSTQFTRLSFNGETSVVRCEPKTGRMHQIRVHLQWLGYPIMNDPIYNHPAWKQIGMGNGDGAKHSVEESGLQKESNIVRVIGEIVRTNFSSEKQASRLHSADTQTVMSSVSQTSLPAVGESGNLSEDDHKTVKYDLERGLSALLHTRGVVTGTSEPKMTLSEVSQHEQTVDQHEQTVDQHEQTVDQHEQTVDQHEQTVDQHEQTVDQHEQTVDQHEQTVDQHEQTVDQHEQTVDQHEQTVDQHEQAVDQHEQTNSLRVTPQISASPIIVSKGIADEWGSPLHSLVTGQSLETEDPDCTECQLSRPDPSQSDLVMYLHALSYKGEGWEFSTAVPHWAVSEWKE